MAARGEAVTIARRVAGVLLIACVWLTASAHLGNTLVVQDGAAGPYGLRVLVRPPAVIPGLVDVVIRTTTPNAIPTGITLRPALWRYGTKGAPAAEAATPVPGEPGTFQTQVWIMSSGSYALHVGASGPAGSGTLLVPYTSVATATLGMPNWLGWALAVLGGFLVFGLASVVGAASRESTLPVGVTPDRSRYRRARFATAIGALVASTLVFGGWTWWNAVERDYRQSLERPLAVQTSVTSGTSRTLTLHIADSAWRFAAPNDRPWTRVVTPLMPDHGKLMHLFLIAAGGRGAVAHLHPIRTDERTFTTGVPEIPAGSYWLFADVVHESGATRTFVDTVDVGAGTAPPNRDGDDAWALSPVTVNKAPAVQPDSTQFAITIDGTPQVARDIVIHARLTNADGTVASVTPWLGMAGHAMVLRTDGTVFMHLHPLGTGSMAAQERLQRREAGDTAMHGDAQPAMHIGAEHAMSVPGDVSFPVAFPSAGTYRVFVQLRRTTGQIATAALDLSVSAAPERP
jgi:hypothetical protein